MPARALVSVVHLPGAGWNQIAVHLYRKLVPGPKRKVPGIAPKRLDLVIRQEKACHESHTKARLKQKSAPQASYLSLVIILAKPWPHKRRHDNVSQRMGLIAWQQALRPMQAVVLVVSHEAPVSGLISRNEHHCIARPVSQKKFAMPNKDLSG